MLASCEIEREKVYTGPGLEPGPLALRTSALPLRYPGQLSFNSTTSQQRALL